MNGQRALILQAADSKWNRFHGHAAQLSALSLPRVPSAPMPNLILPTAAIHNAHLGGHGGHEHLGTIGQQIPRRSYCPFLVRAWNLEMPIHVERGKRQRRASNDGIRPSDRAHPNGQHHCLPGLEGAIEPCRLRISMHVGAPCRESVF